jgi:hypothetical protein
MEKDIGKIQKNDTTNIVLRIDDFAGRRGFTIREFVESERYTGFTKAGVRILASDFAKFKEMINSISEDDMKEDAKEDAPVEEKPESSDAPEQEKAESEDKKDSGKEELPDY